MDHWMGGFKKLFGRLTVSLDHGGAGFALNRISDGVQVEAVVSCRMKYVDRFDGGWPALFEAEHEIDPVIQRF